MSCPRIPIVVVEAHHHALEHIHSVIRRIISLRFRRNIGGRFTWTLVNFDSHPDMATPNVPFSAIFNPRRPYTTTNHSENVLNLYEMLDMSSSGIAEWILPLVIAADLHKIYWVKNSWSRQFEVGEYNFSVGASWCSKTIHQNDVLHFDLPIDAVTKVSLGHPYYIEDASFVPDDELVLKQNICLVVVENLRDDNLKLTEHDEPWCLSIDLDYFSCLNPFICDLEATVDAHFANLLLKLVDETLFRRNCARTLTMHETRLYKFHYETVHQTLIDIFLTIHRWPEIIVDEISSIHEFNQIIHETISKDRISSIFKDPDSGNKIWSEMIQYLVQHKMFKSLSFRRKLADAVISSLPCLFIPHHPEKFPTPELEFNHLNEKVKLIGDAIRRLRTQPPFMVTIARSSSDGFTPDHIVKPLQDAVLRELHSIFCDHTACRCYVVLDYGENEGSEIDVSQILI